jgi:hypothetical protein
MTSTFTTTSLFSELCKTPRSYTQIPAFLFVKAVIPAFELTLPFTQWLKGAFSAMILARAVLPYAARGFSGNADEETDWRRKWERLKH